MSNDTPFRSSNEIELDRQNFIHKVESLHELKRTKPDEFTAEHETEMETCLDAAERCIVEAKSSRQQERLELQKSYENEPARPLLRTTPQSFPSDIVNDNDTHEQGLKAWITMKFGKAEDQTPQSMQRCQKANLNPNTDSFYYQASWNNLNYKVRARNKAMKRTVLSTGGSGTGADWTYNTYSDKVKIRDAFGDPYSTPQLLDGNGNLLPVGSPSVYLTFRRYQDYVFTTSGPGTGVP